MELRAKILLVEADPSWIELLKQLLKSYRLTVVKSAEEALDILDEKDFATVIINLELPDHNGIELLNERVSHPDLLDIPVIVYASWPEIVQIDEAAWQAYSVQGWLRQTNLVRDLPRKLAEIL